jgi:hypothetical protein
MEHLTHEELEGYGEGVLATTTLLATDQHLFQCATCRRELRALKGSPALPAEVLEMEDPVHLTYEEMSGFVESKLTDGERERIDVHVHLCRSCAYEVQTLQAFEARMEAELKAIPVTEPEPKVSLLLHGFRTLEDFFTEFWATPQRLRLASTGASLMFLGLVSLVKFHMTEGILREGSLAEAHITMLSVSAHPHLFYGGFLIIGCGAFALLHGLFKR